MPVIASRERSTTDGHVSTTVTPTRYSTIITHSTTDYGENISKTSYSSFHTVTILETKTAASESSISTTGTTSTTFETSGSPSADVFSSTATTFEPNITTENNLTTSVPSPTALPNFFEENKWVS